MVGDFSNQEVRAPAPDIQRLPDIESMRAVRVRYRNLCSTPRVLRESKRTKPSSFT
jgi:hypothetical protein